MKRIPSAVWISAILIAAAGVGASAALWQSRSAPAVSTPVGVAPVGAPSRISVPNTPAPVVTTPAPPPTVSVPTRIAPRAAPIARSTPNATTPKASTPRISTPAPRRQRPARPNNAPQSNGSQANASQTTGYSARHIIGNLAGYIDGLTSAQEAREAAWDLERFSRACRNDPETARASWNISPRVKMVYLSGALSHLAQAARDKAGQLSGGDSPLNVSGADAKIASAYLLADGADGVSQPRY